jgi:hypothetical protein
MERYFRLWRDRLGDGEREIRLWREKERERAREVFWSAVGATLRAALVVGSGRRILGWEGDFENFGEKSGKSGGEFELRLLEAELILFLFFIF